MTHQFRGSYGVTITPFTEDGKKIDIAERGVGSGPRD